MQSVFNDTTEPVVVVYCADPSHDPGCPGEVERAVQPGAVFTYDDAADNGPTITSQLAALL